MMFKSAYIKVSIRIGKILVTYTALKKKVSGPPYEVFQPRTAVPKSGGQNQQILRIQPSGASTVPS